MSLVKKPILPPPVNRPVFDNSGKMTVEWQKWFLNADIRIGGRNAYTNLQLETLIADLTTRVEALESP